uniref:Recep_L_domain domain-containing protein n=1 Tax=Caenorhabditis tropicalis TaxID=1561998 RepID=A0A1I7TC75_9PELO
MFSEIKFCFQLITGVFSLLTNSISICLVITHSPNKLGNYKSTIKEEYDLDIDKTTYTGCLYWRTGPNGTSILSYNDLLGALGLSNLMMIPFSIIVYFGYKNCSRIKIVLSQGECEYSKKLQMQLYKALVVQFSSDSYAVLSNGSVNQRMIIKTQSSKRSYDV